jgi:hypothetical protein
MAALLINWNPIDDQTSSDPSRLKQQHTRTDGRNIDLAERAEWFIQFRKTTVCDTCRLSEILKRFSTRRERPKKRSRRAIWHRSWGHGRMSARIGGASNQRMRALNPWQFASLPPSVKSVDLSDGPLFPSDH